MGTGGGLLHLGTPATPPPLQQPPHRLPLPTVFLSCSSSSSSSLAEALSVDMTPTSATIPRRLTRSIARASLLYTPLTQRSLAALSAVAEGTPVLPPHDHAGAATSYPTTMTAVEVMGWLAATPPEPCTSIQDRDLEEPPHAPPSTQLQREAAVAMAVKEKPRGSYHAVPSRTPWCLCSLSYFDTSSSSFKSFTTLAAHCARQGGTHLTVAATSHRLSSPLRTATTASVGCCYHDDRGGVTTTTCCARSVTCTHRCHRCDRYRGGSREKTAPDSNTSLRLCTLSGLTLRLNVDRRLPLSVLVDRVARHLYLSHAGLQLTFARTRAVFTSGDCASTVRLCD